MKLSVVVPVFNEVLTIREVLDAVRAVPLEKEIVVVDDASTDGTGRLLDRLEWPELKVLRHPVNRGKGAAIRTATAHVTGDAVVIQDADTEYRPAQLPALLAHIERGAADVVYGSRFRGDHRAFMLSHYVGNQLLTALTNVLFNSCLTDMETCYKMMRTSIFRSLDLQANRFDIEPEITAKILSRGCRFLEVPIDYVGRAYNEGKKIKWTDGFAAIYTLVKWRLFALAADDYLEERLAKMHRHHHWAASWVAPHLGDRVAHLGAGRGELARYLLDRGGVLLAESADARVAWLAERFRNVDHVTCRRVDPRALEDLGALEAWRPDTALVSEHFLEVDDPRAVLAALAARLPADARIVVTVPAGEPTPGALDREMGRRRRWDAGALSALLAGAGFDVVHTSEHNRWGGAGWRARERLPAGRLGTSLAVWLYERSLGIAQLVEGWWPGAPQTLVLVARRGRTT